MIRDVNVNLHVIYICVSDISTVEERAEEMQRHDGDNASIQLEKDAVRLLLWRHYQ